MKEYLFLFRGGDKELSQKSAEETQTHMQKWTQWMSGLQENGQLLSAQPLENGGRQISGIKKIVTDGPFMEAKEMVGGYLMCKAEDYNAAVAIAKDCPILEFETGIVEVREIKEM